MIIEHEFQDITDLKAAFKAANRDETLDLSGIPEDLRNVFKAFYELIVVNEALNMAGNKKWIPDEEFPDSVPDDKYLLIIEKWKNKIKYHGNHRAKALLDLSHSKVFAYRSLSVVEHMAKYFLHVYGNFMLAYSGKPEKK